MIEGVMDRIKRDPISKKSIRTTRIVTNIIGELNELYQEVSDYDKKRLKVIEELEERNAIQKTIQEAMKTIKVSPFFDEIRYDANSIRKTISGIEEVKQRLIIRASNTKNEAKLKELKRRTHNYDYILVSLRHKELSNI